MKVTLDVMEHSPQSLFISALYPVYFLHFDFLSLLLSTLCFAPSLCSVQGRSCYFAYVCAYVYFINAW